MLGNILFIGCGKMGSAMAQAIISNPKINNEQIKIVKRSIIIDEALNNIEICHNVTDFPQSYKADVVFLCVKPQNIDDTLQDFIKSAKFHKDTIFISIIAGKNISYFSKILGINTKIIRTMPNLAIKDDCGILPYLASSNINKDEVNLITDLFTKSATVFDVKDESLFDVITAIFGCGPAYILLLQEILHEIAIKGGLDNKLSEELIKKLFFGTSLMANNSADFTKSRLEVTSKNGVTQSLTEKLQENESLKNLFNNAINNAIARSKELS